MVSSDKEWQAEEDLRTLMEAKRIKADPKRYKAAIAKGRERLDTMMKIVSDDDASEDK